MYHLCVLRVACCVLRKPFRHLARARISPAPIAHHAKHADDMFTLPDSSGFVLVVLLFLCISPQTSAAPKRTYDHIVVGAGISGAGAAATLKKAKGKDAVLVLEARERVGGRLYSEQVGGYTINLGASWIHGLRGNPLVRLAEQAGVDLSKEKSDYDDSHNLLRLGQAGAGQCRG